MQEEQGERGKLLVMEATVLGAEGENAMEMLPKGVCSCRSLWPARTATRSRVCKDNAWWEVGADVLDGK